MRKRPIGEQVIVVTGGSSGIGLATARLAAERGARVVLVARGEARLADACARIGVPGRVVTAQADVGDEAACARAAEVAVARFGRIDTWVNCAGNTVFAGSEEVPVEDMRKVFDVVFWGVVNGCRAALPHVRRTGGTIVNVGSIETELPVPLSGAYAAAKHAVKGYTDVLRVELARDHAGVSISLVNPSAIATPLFDHAKSYLDGSPRTPMPAYAPEVVGETILRCAEHPVREIVVGGLGRALVAAHRLAPGATDAVLRATMYRLQEGPRRADQDAAGTLEGPKDGPARERGAYRGPLLRSSVYTRLASRPAVAAGGILVAGAAVRRVLARRRRRAQARSLASAHR